MGRYLVTWQIDVEDVDSPQEAAQQAWETMRREDSTANCFTVVDVDTVEFVQVDLSEEAQ